MTHIPRGAKSSKKCKANILLNSKHESVNLFTLKRIAGMIISIELSLFLLRIFRLLANACSIKRRRNS
jgi:hypothetical protein